MIMMPHHLSEDLARLMGNVTLNEPMHNPAGNNIDEQNDDLCADIQALALNASKLVTELQHAQDVNQDGGSLLSRRVAALGLVLKRSAEIAKIAHDLEDSTVRWIMSRLMSSYVGGDVRKLLEYFDAELREIVHKSCKDAGWGQASVVRTLETCHIQASTGSLHVENYFDALYETSLESPYDPDFESEAYYDHENRLQVDEGYAEAENMRKQRRCQGRKKNEVETQHAWIGFWVRKLHNCLDGPTLFWPYPHDNGIGHLPDVPQYLFRTFDSDSSGKSDKDVVASPASIYQQRDFSRWDLLSLKLEDRAAKLGAHLAKTCFGTDDCADNLMSWSSSMLFVLQYAIWRCSKGRMSPADICICVVDTTKFPRGQFARDVWLLQQCRGNNNVRPSIKDAFRLRETGYDNGEYLSQGLLVHRDRSAVTTLENIVQSGLYNLYPDFDDPDGKQKWTNRVLSLRSAWAQPQLTSHEELERASQIATKCFGSFQAREMAICLLTLKNRILKDGSSKGTQAATLGWLEKEPAEVQRSIQAIRALNTPGYARFSSVPILAKAFVRADLEDVFICTRSDD